MRCVPLVVALSLLPVVATGATFSAPLPELVGVIDFLPGGRGAREARFDVGQRFSEIEGVSIEVEAHVFAREFDVCGRVFDPEPCVHEVQLLGLAALLDEQESPVPGVISTNALTYGDLRDFEGAGVAREPFEGRFDHWDFLLDGEGILTLFWSTILGDPDRIILNVVEPRGEIFAARIIIEGTPVPEPSTGLLLAIGILVLARQRTGKPD